MLHSPRARPRSDIVELGMITWEAWEMLKAKAVDRLPPQMAEMVRYQRERKRLANLADTG